MSSSDLIRLTISQISQLAEFAGLSVTYDSDISDDMELCIERSRDQNDTVISWFWEHPEEGKIALTRDVSTKVSSRAPSPQALTFDAFRSANVTRCLKWHPRGLQSWSPSDWMTAVVGELGELASLLKMRNRERDGLPGNKFSPTNKQLADELADVLTYLDLLAATLGVDMGVAVAQKFNEVIERVGFPDRIPSIAQEHQDEH